MTTVIRAFMLLLLVPGASLRSQQSAANPPATSREVLAAAAADTQLRIVVSLARRRLAVVTGREDTLRAAPVAVGSGRRLAYGGRRWDFTTPRGIRTVLAKERDPMWVPPDWHYVEVARTSRLRLVWLRGDTTIDLGDRRMLIVRAAGIRLAADSADEPFAPGAHVVVGDTLYVPPVGYENRKVPGELGRFRLVLGGGLGIHGTPHTESIGRAVTHGCLRLDDADIAWLYDHVPVGTRVYLY